MKNCIQQSVASFTPPIGLSLLLGCLLRLSFLGAESIWVDEAETFRVAVSDEKLLALAGTDPHPLSFYFLYRILSPWILQSDFWFRLPSALASCAGLAFAALFVQRLALDRRLAAWSLATFAFLPASIHYAQEARAYAVLQCFEFLALAALASALQTPSRKNLILLAASIALCAHIDGFGLAVCGAVLLFVLWKTWRREISMHALLSVGTGLALAIPYYAIRVHAFLQAQKFDELSYAKLSLLRVLDVLVQLSPVALGEERLSALGLTTIWIWPLAGVLALAFATGVRAPRNELASDTKILFLLIALLPLGVFAVLTGISGMEFLEVRYLLLIVPGLIPLLALGALRAQKFFVGTPHLALGVLPLLISATSLVQINSDEDWKGLHAQIAAEIEPGDLFLHEQIQNYTQLGISPIRAYAFQHGAPIAPEQCIDYRVRELTPGSAVALDRDRAYFDHPERLVTQLRASPTRRIWTLSSHYATYPNLDLSAYATLEGEWQSHSVAARLWVLRPSQ